ncbi:hypothetical protein M426DRAFT_7025 [Hypoxylon sp. CI-4A]|nr:hypothetical protein M426DRAFT_7025 [Hypoxylon sp. CI-4A]
MASESNPLHDLKKAIAKAINEHSGPYIGLEITAGSEQAGDIPYDFFWAVVDPRQVIPRGTKEWEKAQWRTDAPIITIDFSKVVPSQAIDEQKELDPQIVSAVERVIDEYTELFDNGNDTYPPQMGVDPRLHIVIFKPFNISVGPRRALVRLPPTCTEKFKADLDITDDQVDMVKKTLVLNEENHLSRVQWENEWTQWVARTARRPGLFSKLKSNLKKLARKNK